MVMMRKGFVRLFVMTLVTIWSASAVAAQDYVKDYSEGMFALQVQKYDRAIEFFTLALQKNPKFAPAYFDRAIAFSKKGDYDKSIADFQQAIQLNPDNPDVYGLLGVVYEIKKDYASALKVYRAALPRVKTPAVRRGLEAWISQMEEKLKGAK
jgi:tetratricopeptide (TPR) repeat protein